MLGYVGRVDGPLVTAFLGWVVVVVVGGTLDTGPHRSWTPLDECLEPPPGPRPCKR